MVPRAPWGLLLLAAACRGPTPTARDRVLAKIPAASEVVVAADGSALASPRLRGVLDVLRAQTFPAALACVIDAAQSGEQVAVGIDARAAITVVLASSATIKCPALSKVDGVWVATLGGGVLAASGSVLDDARFARARPYLRDAPIAVYAEMSGGKLLATARPAPLEAWLTIDTAAAPETETSVRAFVARLAAEPTTRPFAANVTITREATQVIARLASPVDGDLSLAVRTVIGWLAAPAEHADPFSCPPVIAPVLECHGGRRFVVSFVGAAMTAVIEAEYAPIVTAGTVTGLRLVTPIPTLGLVPGDLVLAADGRHVTNRIQLTEILRRVHDRTTVTVQRAGTTAEVEVTEH